MEARALALLALLAGPLAAQPILPSFLGLWKPVTGHGAIYQVTDRAHQVEEIEIDVVGEEPTGFWIETAYHGLDERLIRQLIGPQGALRVLTHEGNDTRELPRGGWQGGGLPVELGKPMASESVEVPAGRFLCQKYQLASAVVWLDPSISPYGLVRLQSRELGMELKRVVTGAVSRFPAAEKH